MPKSLQYVIDHADEIAQGIEDLDPSDEELREGVPLAAVRRAVFAVGDAQRALLEAIVAARGDGISWAKIGAMLGTSGEAARQRYAAAVKDPDVVSGAPGQVVMSRAQVSRGASTGVKGRRKAAKSPAPAPKAS
jgi:hypothetical protein